VILLGPPFVVTDAELIRIVDVLAGSLEAALDAIHPKAPAEPV
jgi:hypothetical protein